jgi:uncharacterized membrane protein
MQLAIASALLVVTHFALSHPLRGPLVARVGEGPFRGIYSVVAVLCLWWMWRAFGVAGGAAPLWGGFGDGVWIIASAITLVAMVLFAGSLVGNPALPAPGAQKAAQRDPTGVFCVTRHPMMWGFALWALAHLIAAPTPRTIIVAIAIAVLALVGAHLQDRKKERLMGSAWNQWESRTSYWPRFARLPRAGMIAWIGGIAIWLLASWLHPVEVGIWRWI